MKSEQAVLPNPCLEEERLLDFSSFRGLSTFRAVGIHRKKLETVYLLDNGYSTLKEKLFRLHFEVSELISKTIFSGQN
jgi:hypothetical protein